MEIKLVIICADCKKQICNTFKTENQEAFEILLRLADNFSDKIAWHNLNHGQQVYAALVVEDRICNSPKSLSSLQ
jgi:hypothetical protein